MKDTVSTNEVRDVVNDLATCTDGMVGMNGTVTTATTTGIIDGSSGYILNNQYITPTITPTIHYYWPQYSWWPVYWPSTYEGRYAAAFKMLKVLVDKKLVKISSVSKYQSLIDEIVSVL